MIFFIFLTTSKVDEMKEDILKKAEETDKGIRELILEREFIGQDSTACELIDTLGLGIWVYDCPYCDKAAVSTAQIGVRSRLWGHIRREHKNEVEKER